MSRTRCYVRDIRRVSLFFLPRVFLIVFPIVFLIVFLIIFSSWRNRAKKQWKAPCRHLIPIGPARRLSDAPTERPANQKAYCESGRISPPERGTESFASARRLALFALDLRTEHLKSLRLQLPNSSNLFIV